MVSLEPFFGDNLDIYVVCLVVYSVGISKALRTSRRLYQPEQQINQNNDI